MSDFRPLDEIKHLPSVVLGLSVIEISLVSLLVLVEGMWVMVCLFKQAPSLAVLWVFGGIFYIGFFGYKRMMFLSNFKRDLPYGLHKVYFRRFKQRYFTGLNMTIGLTVWLVTVSLSVIIGAVLSIVWLAFAFCNHLSVYLIKLVIIKTMEINPARDNDSVGAFIMTDTVFATHKKRSK